MFVFLNQQSTAQCCNLTRRLTFYPFLATFNIHSSDKLFIIKVKMLNTKLQLYPWHWRLLPQTSLYEHLLQWKQEDLQDVSTQQDSIILWTLGNVSRFLISTSFLKEAGKQACRLGSTFINTQQKAFCVGACCLYSVPDLIAALLTLWFWSSGTLQFYLESFGALLHTMHTNLVRASIHDSVHTATWCSSLHPPKKKKKKDFFFCSCVCNQNRGSRAQNNRRSGTSGAATCSVKREVGKGPPGRAT